MSVTSPSPALYRAALCDRGVWRRAAKLGLIVGLMQVSLNQGDHWLRHEVTTAVVVKTVLSPVISFAIAFASAAATRIQALRNSPPAPHV